MRLCIVAPGHSVERDAAGVWHSADLYQEVTFPDGGTPPFERTGIHKPHIQPNGSTSYLAGSRSVVAATAEIARRLVHLDPHIIIPAGRPAYLAKAATDDTGISEGIVMKRELQALLGAGQSISVEDKGLVTKDDVTIILQAATDPDYTRVLVVMMAFRIPRTEVLMQEVLLERPELVSTAYKIAFVPAEVFAPNEGYLAMYLSDAYERTMGNERFGIRRAFETGKTATTGGKT